jgi:antitoxin (DNA-binding transcriptional repressor) of toxin-antitoxin stability system
LVGTLTTLTCDKEGLLYILVYDNLIFMESYINATELARNLSDVLNRIHYRHESFLMQRGGQSVARLSPAGASVCTWAQLKELLTALPSVDDEFADDVHDAIAAQDALGNAPWEP